MRSLKSPIPLTESADDPRKTTWAGQASWAVGPHHCGDCKFFLRRVDRGSCKKAKQLMMRQRIPRFPITALSCRYFIAKPQRKVKHIADR